jgi:predicted AlkP superfamily phosphohydrolase/phosphomutase
VQVVEYGLHDAHFGAGSRPAGLFDELRRAQGAYPVASCDHRGGSVAANLRLLDDLLGGIERKTRLLLDVLARERWDLLACAFSEAHCGGHWFWHYTDPSHPGFTRDVPPRLSDAIRTIYARLDAAIGLLMDAAGAEATIVLASHGMAPYVAGYQLLPEVLARLGLCSGGGGPSLVRDVQHTLKHWIPRRYWERVGRLVVERPAARVLLQPVQRRSAAMFFPLESPATKAVYVPNNTIGAIRLNLRGREPFGSVSPGAEAGELLEEIRSELLALRQPESGEPIVAAAATAAETFGPLHHPDVPDLIVRFRQDLGLLDTCESPRVGRIHVPVGSRWGRRSGDHSPRSAVWIEGLGFPAGSAIDRGRLIDVAPTVLEALACEPPASLDGRALGPRTA